MYSLKIRDHIMIAHSLNHETFGPARKLHGATFIVDVTFYALHLNEQNIVLDISIANKILASTLDLLRYQNLDNLPFFNGKLTTVEFLAKFIHDEIQKNISGFFTGKIAVTLAESHLAWATFETDEFR